MPDWDHTPFTNTVQSQSADQCFELKGNKFVATSLAPTGKALAYSTPEGIYVTPIADNCALTPTLLAPGASSPDWGPADVPAPTTAADDFQQQNNSQNNGPVSPHKPTLKLAKKRTGVTATLTTGEPGKATLTATLKGRKTKKTVTIGKSGKASVAFKLRKQGTVTVKATFKQQSVSAKLRLG